MVEDHAEDNNRGDRTRYVGRKKERLYDMTSFGPGIVYEDRERYGYEMLQQRPEDQQDKGVDHGCGKELVYGEQSRKIVESDKTAISRKAQVKERNVSRVHQRIQPEYQKKNEKRANEEIRSEFLIEPDPVPECDSITHIAT
jgi:hypothetical protein